MLLAIDAGNTNVLFAVYDADGEAVGSWRTATDAKRTADEYAVWLIQLMALEGLEREQIDGAIIASVVPAAVFALKTLCRRYFKADPMVIGEPGVDVGVEVRIARPEQVGADRLVNGLAAFERFGGPLIVIDFGTATTFDVIGADGAYEGGVIAPGINLSLEALDRAAARLPRIAIKGPPQRVIGDATIPAMESGAYWGYVGLIEGIVSRIKGEYGKPMKVIATGGLAPLFAQATQSIEEIDPEITMRGLCKIYRINAERPA